MKLALGSLLALAKVAVGVTDLCDPNKCRSPTADDPDLYDCWASGPDTLKPFACADGYKVQDLSSVWSVIYDPDSNTTYKHFTCCPPGFKSPLVGVCTDKVCTSPGRDGTDCWAGGPQEPMTCERDFPYPRKTGRKIWHFSGWYYEYLCCKTSDDTPPLPREWVIGQEVRIALSSITLALTLALVLGIALSPKARKCGYNLYLVSLSLSKIVVVCAVIAAGVRVLRGGQLPCVLEGFLVFDAASVLWINAVISHHLYTLLLHSSKRRRTNPPSPRVVLIQTVVVYLFALAVGTVNALWRCGYIAEYNADNNAGPSMERTTTAKLIIGFTVAVVAVIPFLYVASVLFLIWWKKLLPRCRKTRDITIFFLRVIMVYAVFWLVIVVLISLYRRDSLGGWTPHVIWYLACAEWILSVALALTKPDVRSAVADLLTCRCCWGGPTRDVGSTRTFGIGRKSRTSSTLIFGRKSSTSTARSSSNPPCPTGELGHGLNPLQLESQQEKELDTTVRTCDNGDTLEEAPHPPAER